MGEIGWIRICIDSDVDTYVYGICKIVMKIYNTVEVECLMGAVS